MSGLFGIFYLNMVSSLHSARKFTQQEVPFPPEYCSKTNQLCCRECFVLDSLESFSKLNEGIEFMEDEDAFGKYILDLAKKHHPNVANTATLAPITQKRIKHFYNRYVNDNVSFRGEIDN